MVSISAKVPNEETELFKFNVKCIQGCLEVFWNQSKIFARNEPILMEKKLIQGRINSVKEAFSATCRVMSSDIAKTHLSLSAIKMSQFALNACTGLFIGERVAVYSDESSNAATHTYL